MGLRILKVYPKDVYITMEISLADIKKIVVALDNATIAFDGKDPESAAATTFVTQEFYPELVKLIEDVKEMTGA